MGIGLVIQGPLISSGFGGDGTRVENYKCGEQISKLVKNYGSHFDFICVSTWENSDTDELSILKREKITFFTSKPLEKLGRCAWETPSARNLFESSLVGLKACQKKELKYSLKIRTDQYFDLGEFIDQYFSNSNNISKSISKIQGLYIYPGRPISMTDFAYLGRTTDLIRMFNTSAKGLHEQLSSVTSPWPEGEICRKYIFQHPSRLNAVEKHLLFINTDKLLYPKPSNILDYLRDPYFGLRPSENLLISLTNLSNRYFSTSNYKVLDTLIWRGVRYKYSRNHEFSSETTKILYISALDTLLWINLKKYRYFVKNNRIKFLYLFYFINIYIEFIFKVRRKTVKMFRYFVEIK
jgi:hypothetical protein